MRVLSRDNGNCADSIFKLRTSLLWRLYCRYVLLLTCIICYQETDILQASFQSAMASRLPFKCCGQSVPIALATPWLTSAFIITYNFMILEQSTSKPRYCSNTKCLRFIPTTDIKGQVATCRTCWSTTCTLCGKADHKGVCEEDLAGKAVEMLAKEQGWKSCPQCCQIIQRTEGCLHMTCRCTAEFCFRCLNDWKACGSQCSE